MAAVATGPPVAGFGPRLPTNTYDAIRFDEPLSVRVNEGVGAMTISPCGRDVALASHSGLYVIDLDDPFSPPRWLLHRTSWEVADVQWSPHASRPYSVISTSNQKALVWNLALPSKKAVEHVLHGHKRAITDINFHTSEPDITATCSVDSFVHIWDLRDPKRPTTTFADWNAGASQVKWNRVNPHIIASSHDRTVYLWDTRKGSIPLHSIQAHAGKVNSLDFHRVHETRLITSSNDHTVKGWDYSISDVEPQFTIETDFPVWRARHTPFGDGCAVMPLRGGDNSVQLYNLKAAWTNPHNLDPVYVFKGHSHPIKEFVWRPRGQVTESTDERDFQLVTWAKDNDLRLWPMSKEILSKVNYTKGGPVTMRNTRKGASYETYHGEPDSSVGIGGMYAYPNGRHRNSSVYAYSISPNSQGISISGGRYRGGSSGGRPSAFMTGGLGAGFGGSGGFGGHRFTAPGTTSGTQRRGRGAAVVGGATGTGRGGAAHLDWIAGVRVGSSAFAPAFDSTVGRNYVPDSQTTPGNLGEELSIVGHKFPRITFEDIRVTAGECVISLTGPWGREEGDIVHVRLAINFPIDYPFSPPVFNIEADDSFGESKFEELSSHVVTLATAMTERGQYCLEPILRYLLGEKVTLEDVQLEMQALESAIADTTADDSELFEPGTYNGELSHDYLYSLSSSDEDPLGQDNEPDEEFDDNYEEDSMARRKSGVHLMSSDGVSKAGKPLVDSTPLPKGCGATWAKNGELVCFFVAKPERVKLTPSAKPSEKGFGTKVKGLLGSGLVDTSKEANESEGDSEDSDDSFLESYDDVDYSQFHRVLSKGHPFTNTLRFRHGTGALSATGSQGVASSDSKSVTKNRVVIYDFRHLIPSRRDMAAEYKILGALPHELARWNSQVAEKFNCFEIAYCWRVIQHILGPTNEAALVDDPITLLRTRTEKLPSDEKFGALVRHAFAWHVNWGKHPFGRRWLVEEMFDYFERQKNTQMLANMSCVLSGSLFDGVHGGPLPSDSSGPNTSASTAYIPRYVKSPFQHDLLSRDGQGYFGTASPSSNQVSRHQFDMIGSGSYSAVAVESPTSSHDGSSLLSASPEKALPVVPGKKMAGALSIPSTPRQGGPSALQHLRDISAVSSRLTSAAPTANNSFKSMTSPHRIDSENDFNLGLMFYSGQNTRVGSRSSFAETSSTPGAGPAGPAIPRIKMEIVNEALLDLETAPGTSNRAPDLLDPAKAETYCQYRDQYAAILYSWGLQVQRLEVLKFNYLTPGMGLPPRRPSAFDRYHSAHIEFRAIAQVDDPEIVSTSDMVMTRSYSKTCHLCRLMIRTRFFQCLNCEHILHSDCGVEWFVTNGETECASGCGCSCLSYL